MSRVCARVTAASRWSSPRNDPTAEIIVGCALAVASVACSRPGAPARARVSAPHQDAAAPQPTGHTPFIARANALALLCNTLGELDRDCDQRVTIEDEQVAPPGTDGMKATAASSTRWPFVARSREVNIDLTAPHEAAQLIQELVLGLRSGAPSVRLDLERVRSDPASYLSYRIAEHYWDALTRRIDADPAALARAVADEKIAGGAARPAGLCPGVENACSSSSKQSQVASARPDGRDSHLYYPATDPRARAVFEGVRVPGTQVHALPERPTPAWLRDTTRNGRHGLLTLALAPDGTGRPFVVPGGRFNEMYGWDSFFIVWGLVQDPRRVELARSMADNHAYEILHYGKILNANRTYYLTRSQPPLFSSVLVELWRHLADTLENRRWLEQVLTAAIREYQTVWNRSPRRLALCEGDVCLARYFGEGQGEPPEVEAGHFDWYYQAHAIAHGHCRPPGTTSEDRLRFIECAERLATRYRDGTLRDGSIDEFFVNDQCVRESGHDTTFRWFVSGEERCTDFATVDLNSLLFKIELDLATLIARVFGGTLGAESAAGFCKRAEARARLVRRYLWDEKAGVFFDYDTRRRRRSTYLSATTFYPLWASAPGGVCDASLVTPAMASSVRSVGLRELEAPGGLFATAPSAAAAIPRPVVFEHDEDGTIEARRSERQWEAPNGWAPHQMIAWTGLAQHGHGEDAQRLAYRWLYTIVMNAANYHGTVPEKFDVAARSHAVFQEYGNVNTQFSYIADEGFGWMNASFVVGWTLLSPELRRSLAELVPPESLFGGVNGPK